MLALMGCDDDESSIINYIDYSNSKSDSKINTIRNGKEFLKYVHLSKVMLNNITSCVYRYCKFGTLQYCIIKPCFTIIAIVLGIVI